MRELIRRRWARWWVPVCTAGTCLVVAVTVSGPLRPAPARAAGEAVNAGPSAAAPGAPVHFNRDVRPILSDNCFACHGFDPKTREADMRLDTREGLLARGDNGAAVVPGKPGESLLLDRVATHDADEVMPPPKSKKPRLTAQQVDVLRRWIAQGAPWEDHWAFVPPRRPDVPTVKAKDGVRNPIDAFIRARLEREGLPAAAPEADRATLARRLALDLTGLPPVPTDVDAFVADDRPDAYERYVDRLMSSVRYGERMAVDWLDAGRYADTHGYHIDSGRDQTRWREWVIDAFHKNKPYDQFTVEQIAGDLLPDATIDQRVATGFVRNNMINFEGGAVPEEYRTAYVIDRVNTVGTVWLGLTVGCTQCHDHKYDPITQKEYFQLYAFFNSVPENGLDGSKGNAVPVLPTPTAEQQKKLDTLAAAAKGIEAKLAGPMPEVDAAQAEWEASQPAGRKVEWTALAPAEAKSRGGAALAPQPDRSIVASGPNPAQEVYTVAASVDLKRVTGVRLEMLPDPALPAQGPGRSANGNVVLTEVTISAGDGGKPLALRAASASFSQKDFPVANAIDGKESTGWAIYPQVGKAQEAVFELAQPLETSAAARLTVTLGFNSPFGQHQPGRFRLSVTDAPAPTGGGKLPPEVAKALAVAADKRSGAQAKAVRDYFRGLVSPATRSLADELAKLKKERDEVEKAVPTTMVMAEMAKPRDTFVLVRGQYDQYGERVTPGVPAALPPLPKDLPANRLALARWLVDRNHPLTARVTVNRYWQMFFGTGLVKTADDFGTQGEPPSHAELLDWLAVDFMESGWDLGRLVRLMVTSAAYRQSSVVTPAVLVRDPENRLLARGPRFRLQAEFIRDQALAVSGLLDGRVGGASVSPYQPPGLWEELMSRGDGAKWSAQTYVQSKGDDLYRRTMYTFWKRTSPPPALATFDAPDRETCTVRRSRTNTPLQALVLMNDPTYVEAARKLAERLMTQGGATPEDRIAYATRLVLTRKPRPAEVAVLRELFDKQLAAYRGDPDAAKRLLAVGESPRDDKLDPAELAAWTTVASTLLNLDEAVTKN